MASRPVRVKMEIWVDAVTDPRSLVRKDGIWACEVANMWTLALVLVCAELSLVLGVVT